MSVPIKVSKKTSKAHTTKSEAPAIVAETPETAPEVSLFLAADDKYPGLNAFWHWCDTEASLFRIYCLGRTDDQDVVPPYNPSSKRGQVQLKLEVTNSTNRSINVFWVDYKGREERKGEIRPRAAWHQFTWIDHPWIFRDARTNNLLLHYIPYRVIPSCAVQPTVDDLDDPRIGRHRFSIGPPHFGPYACRIEDPIFPFPAQLHFTAPKHAIEWTLLHCHRMEWKGWDVWIKYLTKIVSDPTKPSYRRIRQGNPIFASEVWLAPAKGLVLAAGFVEHGAFVELGSSAPLTRERVQEISQWLLMTQLWKEYSCGQGSLPQPAGADGFGRAGFGRAG